MNDTLGKITTKIGSGATPRGGKSAYKEKGITLIRSMNIYDFHFSRKGLAFIDEEQARKLDNVTVKEGDILFNITGDSINRTCMVPKELLPARVNQHVSIIRCKNGIDSRFINYYLINLKPYLMQICGVGGTRNALTKEALEQLPVKLPHNQSQIAKVLSDLDAKIELNNKINAGLEAMAKLIYDYWFVQFDFPDENGKPYKSSGGKMVFNEELKREIPEGWEVKRLGVLGNFKNGVNYDPSNPGEVACPIINVRNISASSYFLKYEDLDVIYLRESDVRKYAVHEGSIIIARSGIPGATRLISDFEENTLYCGFAIHYQLENLIQKTLVFFYLKSIEQMIRNGSGGTILKNVNQATLNDLKITLPKNDNVIIGFNKKIDPIFDKINLVQKENQKLSELRDWLLPMLMNGQVSVGEAEEKWSMAAEPEAHYNK